MFIQTADITGLTMYGEELGVAQGLGSPANGTLLFAGAGGTSVDIGTEVALDPGGGGDLLYYLTTQTATIPNPGIPVAPVVVDASESGNLTGTFEYGIYVCNCVWRNDDWSDE
jgi:hypothetical protein